MKKRTITGIVMLAILAPLFLIPNLFIGLQIVVGLGVLIATFEILNIYNKDYTIQSKLLIYFLSLLSYLVMIWHFDDIDQMILLELFNYKLVLVIIMAVFLLLLVTVLDRNFDFNDFGKVFGMIFYVVMGLGSLVILRIVGVQFIVYLFLTTMFTDVFAYLIGIKYGKHKMAPTISPKKSWEGAIAGTLIATILVGTFSLFYGKIFSSGFLNVNNYRTILDGFEILSKINLTGKGILLYILTFMISIIGQLGDLVASKIKRVYNVKDFGNIFPGHGGVLDRFDSAMFAGMFLIIVLTFLTIL